MRTTGDLLRVEEIVYSEGSKTSRSKIGQALLRHLIQYPDVLRSEAASGSPGSSAEQDIPQEDL